MTYTVSYDENGTVHQVSTGGIQEGTSSLYREIEVDHQVWPHDGYVVDGCWVAYQPEVAKRKAEPPPYACEWCPVTFQWIDKRGLQEKINEAVRDVQRKRNVLLQSSDWTQLPDVPIATKKLWATYRQTLRDIPSQPGYPLEVAWPVQP